MLMPKILKNSVQWDINDVYNDINPKHITFREDRLFNNNSKKRIPIPKKLFKKIILTYLKVWITDFFWAKTLYFPIGGLVQKRLYTQRTLSKYKVNNQKYKPIVMQWFNRELLYYINYFSITLNRGSWADFYLQEKIKFLELKGEDNLDIKYWKKQSNRNE